jgi:hypothetical protein
MTGPTNGSPEESIQGAEPPIEPAPTEPAPTEPAPAPPMAPDAPDSPIEPSPAESAPSEPAAIAPASAPPLAEPVSGWGTPAAAAPPPPEPTSGWVAPAGGSGGGRSRGCCLILAIVGILGAVVLVAGVVFLIFIGSQVQAILGAVQFEEGGPTECVVETPATTFSASSEIHFVAIFERTVAPGEVVTTVVTYPDGTSDSADVPMDEIGACVTDTLPSGLAPGHWAIEFRSGSEVLATGGFDITD